MTAEEEARKPMEPYAATVNNLAKRLHVEACGYGCDFRYCNKHANFVFHIDQALETALDRAAAQARREALEEAAKVAEKQSAVSIGTKIETIRGFRARTANAIRALVVED